jgi:FlaA1/EpsC-like NDP-sugar epimerase
MLNQIRNRHLLISDVVFLSLAAFLSFVLRLERWQLGEYWSGWAVMTLIAIVVIPACLYRLGCYAHYWRYASVEELTLLVVAASLGALLASAMSLASMLPFGPPLSIPRSVPFIFWLLALVAITAPRMALRLLLPYLPRRARPATTPSRVLIVGAGNAGETLARELRRSRQAEARVVGFVDDDPLKHGVRIHGALVLGGVRDLPRLLREHQIRQVIVSISTLSGEMIREITAQCERAGAQAKIALGVHDLLSGRGSLQRVRDVQIEDLFRRKPIHTDISAVRALVRGRRVLVTGGGGSIGSELCRQLLSCEPAELIILGHGENSVFEIQGELIQRAAIAEPDGRTTCRIRTVIADIRFAGRIRSVFATHRPEIVFHAAAHKHVPLMEQNPAEAVTNNVLGTRNVVEAALMAGTQHFVMISSDKAVNPTSVMGVSKRVAELIVHHAAVTSGRPYVAVRFGNVLGSRGSVVLTFKKQIAAGGPITVTHPEMRRFFMTIPEAVQLVLQAATIGQGGEVFMLDMGEPVKILDLALDMIGLSGLEPGRDIEVQFSGLRPGEKLYEELFVPGENYRRTSHEKIFTAANASALVPVDLAEQIEGLGRAAQLDDEAAILESFRRLVPQFRQPGEARPQVALPAPALLERAVGVEPQPS